MAASSPEPAAGANHAMALVHQHAFDYLKGPRQVLDASTVCRRWRELATADLVWEAKFEREGMRGKAKRFGVAVPRKAQGDGDGDGDGDGGGGGGGGAIREGDKVEARYRGKARAYPGRIARDNRDGTYDVDYDDGEKERGVAADLITSLEGGGSSSSSSTTTIINAITTTTWPAAEDDEAGRVTLKVYKQIFVLKVGPPPPPHPPSRAPILTTAHSSAATTAAPQDQVSMTGHTGPFAAWMGVYTRLSEETVNGSPLWTKTAGDATRDGEPKALFLYYSKDFKCWAIIDSNKEYVFKNFSKIRTVSQNPRPDRCPDDARWGYFEGIMRTYREGIIHPKWDGAMVCTEVRVGGRWALLTSITPLPPWRPLVGCRGGLVMAAIRRGSPKRRRGAQAHHRQWHQPERGEPRR